MRYMGNESSSSAEFIAFTGIVDRVLAVPHEEIKRREEIYRVAANANPNKRGPKRGSKRKPKQTSASHGPA